MGRSVRRCGRAPQSSPPAVDAPAWEAFPEVNRLLVQRLLGLLVERMTAPVAPRVGGDGGDGDEHAGHAAVGAAGGQGAAVAP